MGKGYLIIDVYIQKIQCSGNLLTVLSHVDHPHENGDIPMEGIPSARNHRTISEVRLLDTTFSSKYR